MSRGLALWEEKGPPSTLSPCPRCDQRARLDVIFYLTIMGCLLHNQSQWPSAGAPPQRRFHFLSCTPVSEAKSPSCRPRLHVDLPAGSLCAAPMLLGLSSPLSIWTEDSFTVVDVQVVIVEYCILLLFVCVFLACEIGPYCLETERREVD